jgi:hypothetical protein
MKRYVAVVILGSMIVGSAQAGIWGLPKFAIEQSDDRFSTDGMTTISSMWNRISKRSVAGGKHIDAKGMFVEPSVIKRTTDGAIVEVLLFVHNETSRDSAIGEYNSIGVPQKISFLTGEGSPIGLPIKRGDRKFGDISSYNSILGVTTQISETGFADITLEQYMRIVNAPALAAKIDGSMRSVTYEVKDVSKEFTVNLRQFYDLHLKQ